MRDFRDKENLNIKEIFEELDYYITFSRPLYAMDYEEKEKFDFVIDGYQPVDTIVGFIMQQIQTEKLF